MSDESRTDLPVAVFDSGVGGLTVLHELLVALPHEDYVYFGDTDRFPYGDRTPAELAAFSDQIADWLVARGAKLVVIACNSATAAAYGALRERLASESSIPVIGVIEPESVLAAAATRNGRIGLLATKTTVESGAYERAVRGADPQTVLTSVACPDLAPVIQAGSPFSNEVVEMVREYCRPLISDGVDTVILGCTHYPLVRPLLQRTLGPDVKIITSGDAAARRVEHALSVSGTARTTGSEGGYRFFCSGDPEGFRAVGERFLQLPLGEVERIQFNTEDSA